MKKIRINLPWPPSVNGMYRMGKRGGIYKTKKAADYSTLVRWKLRHKGFETFDEARLHINILALPPDKRKRDLDNILKSLLDSLQGILFRDDSQIDKITITRGPVESKGKLFVELFEASENE